MPKLIVTEKGSEKSRTFEFMHEGISIGRSEENSITLPSNGVSRKHAQINVAGNNCFLIDMDSGNGTFLNGSKITAQEEKILRHGDVISIDNFNLSFNNLDEMLASSFNEVTDSDILEVKLLKKVLKAIDKEKVPSLEVLNGNFVGKKLFLNAAEMETVIGRDETAEFQIEEYVVSRRHAKIIKNGDEVILEDMNSKNGTFINNRRAVKEVLHDGDRIALGTIVLIFRNPKEVNVEAISLRQREEPRAVVKSGTVAGEEVRPESKEITGAGLFEEPLEDIPEETPDDYPVPVARGERIRLSFMEIGLIGIGLLIFAFAAISFVNLVVK